MEAKDYLKSKSIWLGTTVADMKAPESYYSLEKMLEQYHQAKLKLLDIHVVIASAEFTKAIEKAIEDGEDFSYNAEGGYEYFNQITAVENVLKVIKEHLL